MSDQKTGTLKPFPIPSEGTVNAMPVDFIDLGESVEAFGTQEPKIVEKVAYIFQVDETNPDTNEPFEISLEMTASLGKKANLRKFLGNWRGTPLSMDEIANGVAYHDFVKIPCLVTIGHKVSESTGRKYANVTNVTALPKGMKPFVPNEYKRREFWDQKKEEYANAVEAFRARAPKSTDPMAGAADLPF